MLPYSALPQALESNARGTHRPVGAVGTLRQLRGRLPVGIATGNDSPRVPRDRIMFQAEETSGVQTS